MWRLWINLDSWTTLVFIRKKKKKKEAKKVFENVSMIKQSEEGDKEGKKQRTDNRTAAEKAFAKVQEKRVRYNNILGGTEPPTCTPKIACFVLYLKIINIFLKNNICILS